MKFKKSKEWFLKKAKEEGFEIAAGELAYDCATHAKESHSDEKNPATWGGVVKSYIMLLVL